MKITIDIPDGKYCNPNDNDCPLLKFTKDEIPYCSIFLNLKGKDELRISLADYDIIKHPACTQYCINKKNKNENKKEK